MSRTIWLAYEKLPHPDAVSHPANAEDARTVLELLGRPLTERLRIADRLRNFVKYQKTLPLFCRGAIPCRRQTGRYHIVPWRLAKWLSYVLPATNTVLQRTMARIQTWLDHHGPFLSCPQSPRAAPREIEFKVFAQPTLH